MEFERTTWRLVKTRAARGAWNMAVDEAILEAVGRGESPPTLRLYAWAPPCLSLGYAQASEEVDENSLGERDWEVVRRPTGGRAILHTDELTYSVIAPHHEPRLAGGILESYKRLSGALAAALKRLGLETTTSPKGIRGQSGGGPVCFEEPSDFEILYQGKKLIGSAQARRREGILQHGTLPLEGDLGRITQVLKFDGEKDRAEAAERVNMRAATVEEALGRKISWEEVAVAFRWGFEERLNLDFEESELTSEELARTEELVEEKYANVDWTRRA